ncbi:MAG: LysM peptidoglycan-binding domain-containing protein, partial [Planctomycetota bacterium]
HRTSREESRLPEVATTAEHDAPPQLNASMEEAPAQATDLFDVPSEAVATIEEPPATTEIADATPRGRRGRGQKHQHPEVTEEVPTQINEPIESDPMQGIPTQVDPAQQPAEITGFDVSEPAATNEFAQTGGTVSEPIRRRGTSPRSTDAAGVEMAQVPTQAEPTAPPHDHLTPTTPRTTAPRTSPRATTPRTAAVEPTPATPPIPTQPRVGSVPPPLDPNDPRLGGYREAELPVAGTTHRTASRPQAAPVSGQFDPHHQPLVANSGEYVVRPNDNYWRISRKVYGTARYFAALAKHNEASVPDPRHMKPGAMISTPAKELLEQHYGNLLPVMQAARPVGAITHSPTAPKTYGFYVEADGQPAYRIGPTDNLSSISQKTLGRATRWDEIYDLNRERLSGPDALAVGSILKLPADASQTRVVGKPVQHR